MSPLEIILTAIIAALVGAAIQHAISFRRGQRHGELVGWKKARRQMRDNASSYYRQVLDGADDIPPPNTFFANRRANRIGNAGATAQGLSDNGD